MLIGQKCEVDIQIVNAIKQFPWHTSATAGIGLQICFHKLTSFRHIIVDVFYVNQLFWFNIFWPQYGSIFFMLKIHFLI